MEAGTDEEEELSELVKSLAEPCKQQELGTLGYNSLEVARPHARWLGGTLET